MKSVLSSIVAAVLSLAAVLGVVPAVEKAQVSTLRQATWRVDIQMMDFMGIPRMAACSGTFIAPHVMLTANHCYGSLIMVGGTKATVLKQNENLDLMLLYVPIESPYISLGRARPVADEEVVVVGYPFGIAQFVTRGHVQGKVTIPDESQAQLKIDFNRLLSTEAPISGGNSGGGVFTKEHGLYRLVGVISMGGGDVALAISLDQIKEFLK